MKNTIALSILLIGFLIGISSCVSDKPDVKPDTPLATSNNAGVFILNEGNFGWGNASVSYYKFSDNSVTQDAFKVANNRPLGDVCQSMEVFNGKAYVVVNNSGKVEIVDPSDFKSISTINGLTSPRYFLGISPSKAYVTDLYSNSISVLDLNSNTRIKNIPCNGWLEAMVLIGDKAFVTNRSKEYIYLVNTLADAIADSIHVGSSCGWLKEDKNGKLWALCQGEGAVNSARLVRIDPVNLSVELALPFANASDSPWRLTMNGTKDTLYYLNKGVYRFPITNTALPASPLIAQNSYLYYGLGIDPHSGNIYVSDAVDYVQKGKVYRYRPDGSLISTFDVGVIPGDFYFY